MGFAGEVSWNLKRIEWHVADCLGSCRNRLSLWVLLRSQ
jgi:hypothetical protein